MFPEILSQFVPLLMVGLDIVVRAKAAVYEPMFSEVRGREDQE